MVWFKDGLTEEQLKKEYWALCKKYHPDVSKDPNAEEHMKEINLQFDQYWTNQKVREYEWVDIYKAAQKARTIRATVLCWLRRDKENPGKFYATVDYKQMWLWIWLSYVPIKGITDDGPEWEGFKGGLAFCGYEKSDSDKEVQLKKLPAKISPATDKELYYWNKDHWSDTSFEDYFRVECRYGTFWAMADYKDNRDDWIFYVKAELPEEFLKIGNVEDEAKYSARSINTVSVKGKWIPEAKIHPGYTGDEFGYQVFQECSKEEFFGTHDVDNMYKYADAVGTKVVRKDFWFIDNPVVSMAARKGIITIFESNRNFRMRCGHFNRDVLRKNIHLLSIDDAEEIQDYLDQINEEFIQHFKSLVRRGKISLQI